MLLRRLRIQDYTVGWVCALPIELAAATAVLDEKHQSLPHDDIDPNLYTLGSIGQHNVALACLPACRLDRDQLCTRRRDTNAIKLPLSMDA